MKIHLQMANCHKDCLGDYVRQLRLSKVECGLANSDGRVWVSGQEQNIMNRSHLNVHFDRQENFDLFDERLDFPVICTSNDSDFT